MGLWESVFGTGDDFAIQMCCLPALGILILVVDELDFWWGGGGGEGLHFFLSRTQSGSMYIEHLVGWTRKKLLVTAILSTSRFDTTQQCDLGRKTCSRCRQWGQKEEWVRASLWIEEKKESGKNM